MKFLASISLLAAATGLGFFLASARTTTTPVAPVAADAFEIDPVHSTVLFKVKHLGVSYVFGRFDDIAGKISYDAAKPESSSVEITIKTESVDTNAAARDKHLKSDSFFDVKQFPTSTFKSKTVAKNGDHGFKVTGDLTLHGVTKSVTIDMEQIGAADSPKGKRAGFYGDLKLKRSDYGMTYMLDGLGDEVLVMISIEAGTAKAN